MGGPGKVVGNTLKGFDLIGQRYVVNRYPADYEWNWVHDSEEGFVEVALVRRPFVFGPNLVSLPGHLPTVRPRLRDGCVCLCHAAWAVERWRLLGFSECRLASWYAGIDTEAFRVTRDARESNRHVLVYYKRRHPALLEQVLEILRDRRLQPEVIRYGSYDEEQYRTALSRCSFGVWLGQHETQGIALLEALSSGLPLIVLDAVRHTDRYGEDHMSLPPVVDQIETTSAPLFDERCGVKIRSASELGAALDMMAEERARFASRQFVLEKASVAVSASKIQALFAALPPCDTPRSEERGRPFAMSATGRCLLVASRAVRRARRLGAR